MKKEKPKLGKAKKPVDKAAVYTGSAFCALLVAVGGIFGSLHHDFNHGSAIDGGFNYTSPVLISG